MRASVAGYPKGVVGGIAEAVFDQAFATYRRGAAVFGAAVLSAYILFTALTALFLPDANWDMIPYLAVAEESRFPDAQALHDFAYSTVKAGVSEGEYRALTDDGGGFRSHMATNAADFHSLLGMYRVKIFYAKLLSAVSAVLPPIDAMRAVSFAAALAFGAAAFFWLRWQKALALGPFVVALLMMSEFGDAVRASSPDVLCAALMFGGVYAFMRKREALTALLLFAAFLVRPDNIIFLAVLVTLLLVFGQRSWGVMAGSAASLAAYFAISHWAGHPGWWPHLYFSSIQQQLNMDGFSPDFSVVAYVMVFAKMVIKSVAFTSWLGVLLLAVAGWYATASLGFRLDRRAGVLFAALILGALAKFTAFPIFDTRIYLPNLIPPFLLLVGPLTAVWAARAKPRTLLGEATYSKGSHP